MTFEVPGFVAGAIAAGIKKKEKKDLAIIFSEVPACAAGLFTTNRVQAAPVMLDRKRIRSGCAQAIIANSGNANACTGPNGMEATRTMTNSTGSALGIKEQLVLVASTGVIGEPLNLFAVTSAIPRLAKQLGPSGFVEVAQAIMTTDTFPKVLSKQTRVGAKEFTVTAVAKGAGMIRPDMATMLCFVCTDMGANPEALQKALKEAVASSFNTITVDGDTSTNDTVLMLANGISGLHLKEPSCRKAFQAVLDELLAGLALQIVKDGEGATKLVSIKIEQAASENDARQIAATIANSPLVKTAFFGEDANWGRIIAAIGRAGIQINPETIDIFVDNVPLVRNTQGCGEEAEKAATRILKKNAFTITVDLNLGSKTATVHTCDLSTDYVKINANYRT